MEPLRDIATDGYPTDYLVARLRARRVRLLAEERRGPPRAVPPATSDESIWDDLLTEFDWLRGQMNPHLRAVFAPLFMLFGIKTLVLALRNKAAERRAAVERLMRHELFDGDLREALPLAPDAGAAVSAIADAFTTAADESRDLAAAYAAGGVQAFESQLTRRFLARVAASGTRPPIRQFFAAFIDLRNVMTLYKHLRWGFHDAAAFVAGGDLAIPRLVEASSRGDAACLDAVVAELTGAAVPAAAAGEVALESRLLSHLTRRLHRAGREGTDLELILDYVWSVYVQARNRALRLHGAQLDAAALAKELIA